MSSTSSQPDSSGLSVAARAAEVAKIAAELHAAWCERRTLPPLRVSYPWLTIDDAYAISLGFMARRTAAGERIVGKKIGVTSKAVQDMLGVHQPDFGFLTDAMQVDDGGTIVIGERMIQPRAEAEIALVLGSSLKGPGVTEADVLAATASVAACFEIVDSRIDRWDIRIVDTIADNASCGLFVLGAEHEQATGRVVGDGVDDADVPAIDARVDDFETGSDARRGREHVGLGDPGALER